MGRIVQQILDEMSSGSGILLFLQIILFDTAHSFTGIGIRRERISGEQKPSDFALGEDVRQGSGL